MKNFIRKNKFIFTMIIVAIVFITITLIAYLSNGNTYTLNYISIHNMRLQFENDININNYKEPANSAILADYSSNDYTKYDITIEGTSPKDDESESYEFNQIIIKDSSVKGVQVTVYCVSNINEKEIVKKLGNVKIINKDNGNLTINVLKSNILISSQLYSHNAYYPDNNRVPEMLYYVVVRHSVPITLNPIVNYI